jgi:hypothetical protein
VPRRLSHAGRDRVVIFAPDPQVFRWIEHGLFAEPLTTQVVDSLVDVVARLTLDPAPWPQILILEVNAISSCDIEVLGTIRDAGWAGTVLAVGEPSRQMRRALGIDVVLDRSQESEILRKAVKQVCRVRPAPARCIEPAC